MTGRSEPGLVGVYALNQLRGGDRRMTNIDDAARSTVPGGIGRETIDDKATMIPIERDPAETLLGCQRILILGRTGSGKTTLARELAAATGVPHIELDSDRKSVV